MGKGRIGGFGLGMCCFGSFCWAALGLAVAPIGGLTLTEWLSEEWVALLAAGGYSAGMSTEHSGRIWTIVAIVLAILAMAGGAMLLLHARRNSLIAMQLRTVMVGDDVAIRTLMAEPLGLIVESVDADGKVEGTAYAMLGSGGKIALGDGVHKGMKLRLRLATGGDIVGVDESGGREVMAMRDLRGMSGGSRSGLRYTFVGAVNETSLDHAGGVLNLWVELVNGKLEIREGER